MSYYSSLLVTLRDKGIGHFVLLGDSISRSLGDVLYYEQGRPSNKLKQVNIHVKAPEFVFKNYIPCGLAANIGGGVIPMGDPNASYNHTSACTEEKQIEFMTNRTRQVLPDTHANSSIMLFHPFGAHIWNAVSGWR